MLTLFLQERQSISLWRGQSVLAIRTLKILLFTMISMWKTMFIREWWENRDVVTLITRPPRFGKTLLISMVERFFSIEYDGQGSVFEGLSIWQDEEYRQLQGAYPVISLSFADIKEGDFKGARKKICQIITDLYHKYMFLENGLEGSEKDFFQKVSPDMPDYVATLSLKSLSGYLSRYYGKRLLFFWTSMILLCKRLM